MTCWKILTVVTLLAGWNGSASGSTCNKRMDFETTFEGKNLINHDFKTFSTFSDIICESQCFLDDRCISYSFDTKMMICNLSESDHLMHPADFIDQPNVVYRSARNTCDCSPAQTCRYDFVKNIAKCTCPIGFTGSNCDVNIDECTSKPCQNNGVCIDLINSYQCNCTDGTSGTNCEINFDECASNPCVNGATCVDGVGQFTCNCVSGYEGATCSLEIDECASKPCVNGGACIDGLGFYTCSCTDKFFGKNCEIYNQCADGGKCPGTIPCLPSTDSKYNGYYCQCPTGSFFRPSKSDCKKMGG